MEAAKAKIAAEINRDDFELDADEIDDVDFSIYELHPVTREIERYGLRLSKMVTFGATSRHSRQRFLPQYPDGPAS